MSIEAERATTARNIFIAIAIFVALTVVGVVIWGPVALTMAALTLVPVVFILMLGVTNA